MKTLLWLALLGLAASTEQRKITIVKHTHAVSGGIVKAPSASKADLWSCEGGDPRCEGPLKKGQSIVDFDVPKKGNSKIGNYYNYKGIVFKNGRFIEDSRARSFALKGACSSFLFCRLTYDHHKVVSNMHWARQSQVKMALVGILWCR
jgi:hypothetical protein